MTGSIVVWLSGPTYPEYLENPEAEEGVIGCLLDRREQVDWLLENHVPQDSGAWCSDGLCLRLWPCVWWERAAEAERRVVARNA